MSGRRRMLALSVSLAVVTVGIAGVALLALSRSTPAAQPAPWRYIGLLVAGVAVMLAVLGATVRMHFSHPLMRSIEEGERKYRMLFESAFDGVFITRGLIVEDCNPQACRVFACQRDDLVGHSGEEFWLPTQPDGRPSADVSRELIQAALAGRPQLRHWQLRRKDGVLIDAEVSLQAVTLGNRPALLVTVRDVTERRRAEEALQGSERRYRIVAEQTGQMVYDWDVHTGAIYWAGAIAQITGFDPNEYQQVDIGGWAGMIHPEDRPRAVELLDVAGQAGGSYHVEYRLRRKDGSYVYVEDNGVFLKGADGRPARMLGTMKDISERKRAEQELREREAELRSVFRAAPIGIGMVIERVLKAVNERLCEMLGYTPAELLERNSRILYASDEDYEYVGRVKYAAIREHGVGTVETRWRRKDGAVRHVLLSSAPMDPADWHAGVIFTALDVTDRKLAEEEKERLEAQLRQARQMEALGQLAGGIAHDFNNILTSIGGNVELALSQLRVRGTNDTQLVGELREIERSAERAAGLTRQLLAFGRRQVARPQTLDLNRVVAEMEPMLRRLISESITLEVTPAAGLPPIEADASQVEQVLLNLVVNARDAMPGGGTLRVETTHTTLDSSYVAAHADVRPGPYVLLSVSDTGCGMDARTLERAFDPFFTTKPLGQGTGLGLSTVYGIVKQAGGHVAAYSELGHGSVFRVYLPAARAATTPPVTAAAGSEPAPSGTETVLICEDDPVVRDLTVQFLRNAGYTALAASDGAEAVRIAGAAGQAINLLVTDVVMPDMNGRTLADTLSARIPGLAVLYVSGYTANVIAHHGVLDPGVQLLEKPFSQAALLHRVRELLDRAHRAG